MNIRVVLRELGGEEEYGIVEAVKNSEVTKLVVSWASDTCANCFNAAEVQFGHSGAK